jgi:indolepyruvate ferredoxin oxidoreductase beta subunit
VINTRKILLEPGNRKAYYPSAEEVLAQLAEISPRVHLVDGSRLAERAGNPRLENMALLGAAVATGALGIPAEVVRGQIRDTVPPPTVDANLRAFDLGAESVLAGAGAAGRSG